MDPLSIAAAVAQGAQSAWSLGKALYDLIENTKVVDASVKALASEAFQLGNVCDSVDTQVRRLPGLELDGEDAKLFRSIEIQLSECERTIGMLNDAISSVKTVGSNFVEQTVRQIRLNLNREIISESRAQIHAHTANLHISLQLINLKATYIAPRLANQELLSRMSKLQAAIDIQGQRIDSALRQCADSYLTSGTTLYEESVAGGTVASPLESPTHDPHIAGWITSLRELRLDAVETGSLRQRPWDDVNDDRFFTTQIEEYSAGKNSLSHRNDPSQDQSDPRSDSEEDQVALDLVDAAKQEAVSALRNEHFEESEYLTREELILVQELPLQLRKAHDLFDINYRLAVCAFHLHESSTAASALLTVIEQQPRCDQDALNLCNAGYLLALTYTRLGRVEQARSTCESSYLGRRRMLGKDHQECYLSLALLALICERQQSPYRAKSYLSMIPQDRRQRLKLDTDLLVLTPPPGPTGPKGLYQPPTSQSASVQIPHSETSELGVLTTDRAARFVQEGKTKRSKDQSPGKLDARAIPSHETIIPGNEFLASSASQPPTLERWASSALRRFKNRNLGYSPIEIKVRNATSNESTNPTYGEMQEIAKATFSTDSIDFWELTDVLEKRLRDKAERWLHVWKALKVVEHCLLRGSESFVAWVRRMLYVIEPLGKFEYVDKGGRDVGENVRIGAKALIALILDNERLCRARGES